MATSTGVKYIGKDAVYEDNILRTGLTWSKGETHILPYVMAKEFLKHPGMFAEVPGASYPITSSSATGVVNLMAGEVALDQPWWPGRNQLINEYPLAVGIAYNRDGALHTGNANVPAPVVSPSGGGTMVVDLDVNCPITSGPAMKIVLPAGAATQYQKINYWDIPVPVEYGADGTWLIPLYIPIDTQLDGSGNPIVRLQVQVSDKSSVSGTDYRSYNFDPAMLHRGWNILQCLNNEVKITSGQYGVLGTTYGSAWSENSAVGGPDMVVRSVTIRVLATVAPTLPTPVWLGNVSAARPGWATSAIMWSADDVPQSFYEYALPILEEFGFGWTGNCVNTYANDTILGLKEIMTMDQIRDALSRGHEIWGHANRHDRMSEGTEAERTRALKASRDFWRARGITTAAHCMAYPFGAFDQQSVDIAKSLGYRLIRATHGLAFSPLTPGLNPYYLPAFTTETTNSWWVDAGLNGMIKRGQACFTYMHNCYPGGAGINTAPAETSFYADHLRRWCELVAGYEQQGRVVCPTASQFFKLTGFDPMRDPLG